MKFVTLIITVMMFSFSADAQTNRQAAGKKAVAKVQQETKSKKVKSPAPKAATGTNDVTTLTDERSHKAKWTFDEMLKRRLEIDAEEGEREQRKD